MASVCGALAGRELAIDKAANWICGGYVAGLPATRAIAYAIVLIKGTHDFKTPTSAKETELFRMNG